MIIGTPASRKACKEIARETDTVILGFSRGKDCLACWLWLLEFFPKIIPFYADHCPGLGFVQESLQYYEEVFQTKIITIPAGSIFSNVANLVYQPIEQADMIDSLGLLDYEGDNGVLAELVRDASGVEGAWIAWGMSIYDSLLRKAHAKYKRGFDRVRRTIYPCFDWRREEVLQAIRQSGIKLPKDYLLSNRSCGNILTMRHIERMKEMFPEDFQRVKVLYPFIEAAIARNEFRKAHFKVAGGENSPSLPETETGEIVKGEESTQANKSGEKESRQAGKRSRRVKGRQSTKSTIPTA